MGGSLPVFPHLHTGGAGEGKYKSKYKIYSKFLVNISVLRDGENATDTTGQHGLVSGSGQWGVGKGKQQAQFFSPDWVTAVPMQVKIHVGVFSGFYPIKNK